IVSVLSGAVLLGGIAAGSVSAQNASSAPRKLQVTAVDTTAADDSVLVFQHAHPSKNPAGSALKHSQFATPGQRANAKSGPSSSDLSFSSSDQVRFPADLSYFGGAVVPLAQSHPIFLLPNGSCPIATCWGDPETFLTDFASSELAHVTDQYVGQHAGGRYTLGADFTLSYTPPAVPLTDANILAIVHASATLSGETGYGHIYHVFL